MRLGFFNIQCGVAVTKGYWQYVARAHRYLLPHDDRIVEDVARFALETGIDVLGCVEMEAASRRSADVDYAQQIATQSPLRHHAFFASHRVGRWVHQGNSIHARSPLAVTRSHTLPGTGEPRILGEVELTVDGHPYAIFVTHLSLGKRARTAQIDHISRAIGDRRSAVLMGDFNTTDVDELAPLLTRGWHRAPLGPTHPCWAPTGAIDHVLVSRDLVVKRARVVTEVRASDHLPVVVEIA